MCVCVCVSVCVCVCVLCVCVRACKAPGICWARRGRALRLPAAASPCTPGTRASLRPPPPRGDPRTPRRPSAGTAAELGPWERKGQVCNAPHKWSGNCFPRWGAGPRPKMGNRKALFVSPVLKRSTNDSRNSSKAKSVRFIL